MKNFMGKKLLFLFGIITTTLGLVGYSKDTGYGTDGQIEGAIERRLEMDSRVNSELIGVDVNKGHARLFGSVDTLEEKAFANAIASTVMGVQSVTNSIMVKPTVSQDQEIQNKIRQLIDSAGIPFQDNFNVRSVNGTVTLEGTVLEQKNKNKISRLAESVNGVKEVENLIQVVNSTRPDREIYKDVVVYLLWSPLFNADKFKVEVDNGNVSLQGSVDLLVHKNVLVIDLENIRGVKGVKVGKVLPDPLRAFPGQPTEGS